MSDLLLGLWCWLCVALLAGALIFRFMRIPDTEETDAKRELTGLSMLPGYGWEGGEPDRTSAGQAHSGANSGRAHQ